MPVTDDKPTNDNQGEKNYRQKYSSLKVKFESVQNEKESLQTEVRQLQRQLIDILRDNQRLILKVLEYEDVNLYSTDFDRSKGPDNQFNQDVSKAESLTNGPKNIEENFNNNNGRKRSANASNKSAAQKRRNGALPVNQIKEISSDEVMEQSLNGQFISPYEFSEPSPVAIKTDDEHKLDELYGNASKCVQSQSNTGGKPSANKPKAPPRPRGKGANPAAKKEPRSAPRTGAKGKNPKTNPERQSQLQMEPQTPQQIIEAHQQTIINSDPMTPSYSAAQTINMVQHVMTPIESTLEGDLVHISSPQLLSDLGEQFQIQHQIPQHIHHQQQQHDHESPHQHQFIPHQHMHIPHSTEPHHIILQHQVPNPQQIIEHRQQQQLQQHEHQQQMFY